MHIPRRTLPHTGVWKGGEGICWLSFSLQISQCLCVAYLSCNKFIPSMGDQRLTSPFLSGVLCIMLTFYAMGKLMAPRNGVCQWSHMTDHPFLFIISHPASPHYSLSIMCWASVALSSFSLCTSTRIPVEWCWWFATVQGSSCVIWHFWCKPSVEARGVNKGNLQEEIKWLFRGLKGQVKRFRKSAAHQKSIQCKVQIISHKGGKPDKTNNLTNESRGCLCVRSAVHCYTN